MQKPFDIDRPIARFPYLALASAAFFAQHAFVLAVAALLDRPITRNVEFWYLPFRQYADIDLPNAWMAAGLLVGLGSAVVLALLSVRRSRAAGLWWSLTPLTIVPAIQIIAIIALAIFPTSRARPAAEGEAAPDGYGWIAATQGVLAGMAIIVFAVAVGALVFGVYGWGTFVLAPLLVGFTTAYLGNRRYVVSWSRTLTWVWGSTALGGFMLIAFSLEGGLCLLMAFPLAAALALLGAGLGRTAAQRGRQVRPTLMSVGVLPAVFAMEALLPPLTTFETVQTVDVVAPPAAVWRALTSEAPVEPEPPLMFRLGIAYPIRSELKGHGVGAERVGVFSTGVAQERITAWAENRRLAFVVLKDPPAMRELSPYEHVHAPHQASYFRTTATTFDLEPLADGRTRIVERTAHELQLDPALYWLPMTKWVVKQNNARVLAHLKATSETN